MKRFVLVLTLVACSFAGLRSTMAGDHYRPHYAGSPQVVQYAPAPAYPAPQGKNPLLKKLLIGGVLVGVGFAAGRLSAPRPQPYYTGYTPAPYPVHGAHHRHGPVYR